MIWETSWKALKRSPVKTVLLTLLIGLTTGFLCLGVSMFASSIGLLKQADKTYTTIGVLEYLAGDYPDETMVSGQTKELIAQLSQNDIVNQKEVLDWQTFELVRTNVEGIQGTIAFEPLLANKCVIEFKVLYAAEGGDYQCVVTKCHYGKEDYTGSIFRISSIAEKTVGKVVLGKDHTYIAGGEFKADKYLKAFYPMAKIGSIDEADEAYNIKGFPIVDITEKNNYLSTTEGKKWNNVCETIRITNDSFLTMALDRPELYYDFFIGSQELVDGRFWTAAEGEQGAKVCVMETQMARALGAQVGDKIKANVFSSGKQEEFNEGYDFKEGFLDKGEYRIIGLYENRENARIHTLFIPKSSLLQHPKRQEHYNAVTVRLKNGSGNAYLKKIEPYLKENFRITIYDQGYTQTATPIYTMRRNASLIMVLCVLSVGAVLLLFTNLFIVKQQEAIGIMNALGTGKKRIKQYLLHGASIISIIGSVMGGAAGYLISGILSERTYSLAKKTFDRDLRFSSLTMGTQKVFEGRISSSLTLILLLVTAVIVCTMSISSFSANKIISEASCFGGRPGKKHRKKGEEAAEAVPVPKETFSFHEIEGERTYCWKKRWWFPLKEGARTVKRNMRSNRLLFVVALILSVFMIIYARGIQRQEEELPRLYQEARIEAYFTSVGGRPIIYSQMPPGALTVMEESKNVEASHLSRECKYEFCDYIKEDVGLNFYEEELDKMEKKSLDSQFFFRQSCSINIMEHRIEELNKDCSVVMTDDPAKSREFFQASPPNITYIKGYKDFLKHGEVYQTRLAVPAVVTEEFLKETGMKMGTTFMVDQYVIDSDGGDYWYRAERMQVVGKYKSLSKKNTIYTIVNDNELSFFQATPYWGMTYRTEMKVPEEYINYELKDVKNLKSLKDDLEAEGVTAVGMAGGARASMIFDDREFVQRTNAMENNIQFMKSLRYVLFLFVFLIGFVLSYMIIKARKPEFAIMRSLGTGVFGTFLIFFLEQLLVSATGLLCGMAVCVIFLGSVTMMELLSVVLFLAFFAIGSVFSIGRMNRKNVLGILSDRE